MLFLIVTETLVRFIIKKSSETQKLSPIPSPKHPELRTVAFGDAARWSGLHAPQATLVSALTLLGCSLGCLQRKGQVDRRRDTSLLPAYLGRA